MASSSSCFVVVPLAVLLQFLLVSASTKSIDAICQHVDDKAFCIKTLTAYPPAASATSTFQAAQATISFSISYAQKSASFAAKAAKENPNLKKHFTTCNNAFADIISNLQIASSELKESPDSANYDIFVCLDSTTIVTDLIGKNVDKASKTIMTMTMMMNVLIDISRGATDAVGGLLSLGEPPMRLVGKEQR